MGRLMMSRLLRYGGLLLAFQILSGCSSLGPAPPLWVAAVKGDGPGNPNLVQSASLKVKNLPKSVRGNPSSYTVFGEKYRVMDSAQGFQEQGVASWYGRKFHGRDTASGEKYNMHALTAAHKHLPLPTFVRVTRLDTQQSVIVKVNDRGPFVGDRIIDLSYAAAAKLNMLGLGKTEVTIEAVSSHIEKEPLVQTARADGSSLDQAKYPQLASNTFLQVGAYTQAPNAKRMLAAVSNNTDLPVVIKLDSSRQLHLVQIGPLADKQMVINAVDSLAMAGIDSYKLVSLSP